MDAAQPTVLIADITAALDWWREAGVDCDFMDIPRQWIVEGTAKEPNARNQTLVPDGPNRFPAVKASPAPPPLPPPAMIGGDPANWPGELAGFADWWLTEPSLDAGQSRGRIPPRGPEAAGLMVLVPEPEAEDGDSLLSGPQGRLLAAMLAAIGLEAGGLKAGGLEAGGLAAEQVYFASALPRHTPMADWPDLAARGLGAVLRHHIALVRPQRLIAFGRHISALLETSGLESPLADNAPTQNLPILPNFGHVADVPLLVARDLGSLLDRPIAKGNFWQQWLDWSSGR